jgi:putative SOS response-associated peptidase YedK
MCGRFTLRAPAGVIVEQFRLDSRPDVSPRYNIAPTQDVAVVRAAADGTCALSPMRWGLVPSWSKDPKQGARMINARAETVAEKPAFRAAFKRRRCIVPADGYYEWQNTGGKHKQPYLFHLRDDRPFGFAGLWEHWHGDGSGPPLETCTVVTTDAAEATREVHDRMPVILEPDDYAMWLDPEFEDRERLLSLLVPYETDGLIAEPVSTYVNNARNEGPECVAT